MTEFATEPVVAEEQVVVLPAEAVQVEQPRRGDILGGGCRRRRKVLRDNIQCAALSHPAPCIAISSCGSLACRRGITKPTIRRLARKGECHPLRIPHALCPLSCSCAQHWCLAGGTKRISGLIYGNISASLFDC